MKWAVLVLSLLTLLFVCFAVYANANIRAADDKAGAAFLVICAALCGLLDLVAIIIWLAIT